MIQWIHEPGNVPFNKPSCSSSSCMWSQNKILKNTDLVIKCRLIILLTVWYQPTFLHVFSILSPHWTPYWTASNWPRSSWTPVFVLLLLLPLGAPPLAVAPPPNNLLTWQHCLWLLYDLYEVFLDSLTVLGRVHLSLLSIFVASIYYSKHILGFACLFTYLSSSIDYEPLEVKDVTLYWKHNPGT